MNVKKLSLPSLDKAEKREILRIAVILFLIVGITAFVLAVVNELTYRKIDENQNEKINLAMSEVLPARSYENTGMSFEEGSGVSAIYEAKGEDDSVIGYCVQASASGFGGELDLVVGVDKGGKVTKTRIVSMSETPGVGTKASDDSFLSRFEGKSGLLTVTKGDVKQETEIAAISGATVSSRAVTQGVNAALSAVTQLLNSVEEVPGA